MLPALEEGISPPGTAHHAWAGVGHAALVGCPLVEGALAVCEGPVEDLADVGHAVDADSRAPKDVAGRGRRRELRPHRWPGLGVPKGWC